MKPGRREVILGALEHGPATAREISERAGPTLEWGLTPKEVGQSCMRYASVTPVATRQSRTIWALVDQDDTEGVA